MAISTPALIAAVYAASGSTNPIPITLTSNVAPGDCIALFYGTSSADSVQSVTGVTDSTGLNTWVNLGHGGTTFGISSWICVAKAPMVSGVDTISVTLNVTGSVNNMVIASMQGILSAAPQDAYGLTSSGSAGTSISRATGTLAQAAEIVFAYEAHANAGGVPAWSAPITKLSDAHTGTTAYLSVGYSIKASTATTSPTATIASANFTIATFGLRDALAVLPQQTKMRRPAVWTRIASPNTRAVYGR